MPCPLEFTYTASPSRVIFGHGSPKQLASELARLDLHTPMILSTPHRRDQVALVKTVLESTFFGIFEEAAMHTPISVTVKALEYAKQVKADSLVSIGG